MSRPMHGKTAAFRPTFDTLEDRAVPAAADPLQQIDHFVVIYQENWSFDGLYGKFPGANGLANATDANGNLLVPQVDRSGQPLATVDPKYPGQVADPTIPGGLPPKPFDLNQYVPPTAKTGDVVHRFYTQQLQIGNGVLQPGADNNSKFVAWSDNPRAVLSYYDATNLPEGQLAQQYTMDDNFFHAAYGGSFLNHQFLIAAAAPQWNQPIPAGFQSSWNPATQTLKDANLTLDGKYVVNTTFAAQAPHPASVPANKLLQPINNVDPSRPDYTPTIGDRLDQAGESWKWYSGGWDAALAGHADPLFQYHHQPFAYYAKYAPLNADGTQNLQTSSLLNPDAHLQDETRFFSDLSAGNLPAVSFVKPLGPDNEHPGYANLLRGQQHVADIVHAIQNSPEWSHTAIIITYDENGGRWDHVTPPAANGPWGDGSRVPGIVISPYAKKGYVDHTQHDTLSILKTIEQRFDLQPLNQYDAAASSLASSFQAHSEASVGKAYAQPDADTPGKYALIVQGTEGNDLIHISSDPNGVRVQIIGPDRYFDQVFAQPISRLEVYTQGGDDLVLVDPSVTAPAYLFGGAGDHVLVAGGGPSVLVGGPGNDLLIGGAGPSILIGGAGTDALIAGPAGDLLIGGTTAYNSNLAALKALSAEWSRTDVGITQKVADLSGTGSGGKNGSYTLTASTVTDDGVRDYLVGGPGADWFLIPPGGKKKDWVIGASGDDVVTYL